MNQEQISLLLDQIQKSVIVMPSASDFVGTPLHRPLIDALIAFDNAKSYLLSLSESDSLIEKPAGLALPPAQPAGVVGQGAQCECDGSGYKVVAGFGGIPCVCNPVYRVCDPGTHHPDVSCPQCGTGKYSVSEIFCGAGAIVSDSDPGFSGDEALD
jgi:hypothetical protein